MNSLQHILLVEDSPRDAELALEALRDHNLANEVVHVHDGAEALDYLRSRGAFAGRTGGPPALVLLDLKMPKVDGMEVLRQIKRDPALRAIPVVVMTSSRADEDLLDSYNLGVDAYIVKPVQFLDFVGVVKRIGAHWGVIHEPQATWPLSP